MKKSARPWYKMSGKAETPKASATLLGFAARKTGNSGPRMFEWPSVEKYKNDRNRVRYGFGDRGPSAHWPEFLYFYRRFADSTS